MYLFLGANAAAGVGILLHSRLIRQIRKVHYMSDRVLRVDVQMANTRFALCAAHVPHAGYPSELLEQT